jgi:integron integrase
MDDALQPRGVPLLDQVRGRLRVGHYSVRTEEQYVHWIKRFILFHGKRHPREMGAPEVEAFLTHLAVNGKLAASSQNQAKSALLFLYREVLKQELPWLSGVVRAKNRNHLPVVLTVEEVRALLGRLSGTHWLIGSLLYGSGLRVLEGLRLRVHDLEFARDEILVRDGKGGKDRVTMMPRSLIEPLRLHLAKVEALHREDLARGYGAVHLPFALARKYPSAPKEWGWQYVFPSATLCPWIRAPASVGVTTLPIRRSSGR